SEVGLAGDAGRHVHPFRHDLAVLGGHGELVLILVARRQRRRVERADSAALCCLYATDRDGGIGRHRDDDGAIIGGLGAGKRQPQRRGGQRGAPPTQFLQHGDLLLIGCPTKRREITRPRLCIVIASRGYINQNYGNCGGEQEKPWRSVLI